MINERKEGNGQEQGGKHEDQFDENMNIMSRNSKMIKLSRNQKERRTSNASNMKKVLNRFRQNSIVNVGDMIEGGRQTIYGLKLLDFID